MRRVIAADAINAAHRKAALLTDDRNHGLRQREKRCGWLGALRLHFSSGERQPGGGAGESDASIDVCGHVSSRGLLVASLREPHREGYGARTLVQGPSSAAYRRSRCTNAASWKTSDADAGRIADAVSRPR